MSTNIVTKKTIPMRGITAGRLAEILEEIPSQAGVTVNLVKADRPGEIDSATMTVTWVESV